MADFGGADLDAFRADTRQWLEENFPASLRETPDLVTAVEQGVAEATPDVALWKQRMGAKGWGVPTWPAAYGGGGLSRAEAKVLAEEMNRIGARNPIGGMGVIMFGPTLLEYGNEAQKQRHIPPIVRGELRWCQGFSEPGAGSDLASLQTKAEDRGDHWLVNGQKIWTSGAHHADWCFCLVRTDPSKKHEGISFVLIDMRTPGVEPRPILLINGTTPFCETFFTDVKVPKESLVGPLNGGWTIAKRLLQHERQGISGAGQTTPGGQPGAVPGPPLPDLARTYIGLDDDGGPVLPADRPARSGRDAFELGPLRGLFGAQKCREPGAPGARGTDRRGPGQPGPGLVGRRLQGRRTGRHARVAARQVRHDRRRFGGDPEQHHLQAHPGFAGGDAEGVGIGN